MTDYPNNRNTFKICSFLRRSSITDWGIWICTIAIVFIGYLQLITMNKTDQTTRLRDRAYVYFSNPAIIPYPRNNPIVWGVSGNVENAGNMPAKNILIKYSIVITKQSEGVSEPFPLANWSNANVPKVIGAKQRLTFQGGEIPINSVNEARKFNENIFILMEATYTDGFDQKIKRITQMSRSLRFDQFGGHSLGFADSHNCTDEDCKNL